MSKQKIHPTLEKLVAEQRGGYMLNDDPEFHNAGRFNDWRNHVSADLEEIWGELSLETRAALYFTASLAARYEELG